MRESAKPAEGRRTGVPDRPGRQWNADGELRRSAGRRPAVQNSWLFIQITLAVVVFAIPFLAYATNILHIFYIVGSSFNDAGWAAYMVHDADLELHNPPCIFDGKSWLNSHISPLFLFTTAVGHLLPLTRIQFYAAYIGISHALPAVAVFWLLVSGYRMTSPARCGIAALLALAFSFNGLALAIAKFPDYTMFMVGTGTMFLVALVLRRFGVAVLFFLLCLGTREDAGLHLFALLTLLLVLEWRPRGREAGQSATAIFAAAGLLYSIAVIALRHALSSDQSLFVIEYLGNPPFAGVTLSSMATRFLGWTKYRAYVVVPGAAALGWAIARRNPRIILGYAAFVPWGLIHLAAAHDMQGSLPSYYAFPYMFAMFWPLIGMLIQQRRSRDAISFCEPVGGFALLMAATFVPSPYPHDPTHIDLPADFVQPPSLARQRATDRALAQLAGAKGFGTTIVDQSVLALVPEHYRAENLLTPGRPVAPDSVIYFADGFQSVLARRMAARAGLERNYAVQGTSIRVASNRAIDGVTGLIRLAPSK